MMVRGRTVLPSAIDIRNMRKSCGNDLLAWHTNDGAVRFFGDDIAPVQASINRMYTKIGAVGDWVKPDTSTGIAALSFSEISFPNIARHLACNGHRVSVIEPIPAEAVGKAIAFKVKEKIS